MTQFKCPLCGFSVFNRRYPKCERCGELLPEGIAYTRQEITALRAQQKSELLHPPHKDEDQGPFSIWDTDYTPTEPMGLMPHPGHTP